MRSSSPITRSGATLALALTLAACQPKVDNPMPSLTAPTQACSAAGVAASTARTEFPSTVCVLTSQGEFVLGMDAAVAPATVANFLTYVTERFYDGTIIHRLEWTPLQVFQGGGYGTNADYDILPKTPGHPAIALESNNGLSNRRYTIAMARAAAPDSATSQWFVNWQDNLELDYDAGVATPNGYAVFGEVISGSAAVDAIGALPPIVGSSSFPELPYPMVIVYWMKQLR